MKIFSRLKTQADLASDINFFIKRAKETEEQSDAITYKQIKSLGNPLAKRIQEEINTTTDKVYKKKLEETLKDFKNKKYID